ncbi:helix-turn-helix domain-containing protein [Alkaliphilus sp. B6464]|uniref:helix-turn-helix domain-containing protein n=1 Tax=Alkaliphilus sp. B6464 TaxID=2731219 RepID=UPI001BAB1FE7|nr:helix-turn-helix transcriptional regulator [Alkaliphilus sp. B6464]QUH21264.1 helix-turn-helix transcriptional regulator [Alkaliphilus sp. B6464]
MKSLQNYRTEKGYTQAYMAKKLGVSIAAYNLYENGGRKIPRKAAFKIMEILEIENIEEIFLPSSFTLSENTK